MKYLHTLAIFLLMQVSFIQAQQYQTVYPGKIAFFEDSYENVKSLRIDSIESDSIFYSFPMIQRISEDCISPSGISWIGAKVIIQQDGYNLFFNTRLDTIRIKTNALLNEKWIVAHIGSTLFEATVTQIDTLSFLGLQDSVKTISFQAYDEDVNPIDHPLNDKTLLLSKRYGWVRTFNFYLFPDLQTDHIHAYETLREQNLSGLSDPQAGMQNLTWFEVHDYQPGDELHIATGENYWGGEILTRNTIQTILERNDYFPDSIVYMVKYLSHRVRRYQLNILQDTIFEYTLREVITPDPEFDKLPGETVWAINGIEVFSYQMKQTPFLSKIAPPWVDMLRDTDENGCLSDCCADDPCYTTTVYYKGLGGPYYDCPNSTGINRHSRLLYFKKGGFTWGSPLIIETGMPETQNPIAFRMFPIPAGNRIWVSNDSPSLLNLELMNLHGQTVRSEQVSSGSSSINIEALPRGIYLYRITGNGVLVKTGKLVLSE